jgi:hypothetical protein
LSSNFGELCQDVLQKYFYGRLEVQVFR